MVPIYMARGLADGRRQELLAGAERRRPAVVAPRAYGPLAI
jgi:hypothetical protein